MAHVLPWLAYAVAGWIFLVGVYGLVTSRHLVHTVVCLNVAQSATYLLLLGVGWTHGGTAPIFADISRKRTVADPVVQAMTLTDVVVGAATTALLLALTVQVAKRRGEVDPRRMRSLEHESEEDSDEESEEHPEASPEARPGSASTEGTTR